MSTKKYIKTITATIIICLIVLGISKVIISKVENVFFSIVQEGAEKDREERHKETSVKKEIYTDQGDTFIIDMYMDLYPVKNMMDIYEKKDDKEFLIIDKAYGIDHGNNPLNEVFDFVFFHDDKNKIQGYFIQDRPFILYKMKDSDKYKGIYFNDVGCVSNKDELEYVLPFIYEYMMSLKAGSTKHTAMSFLVANKYEKGINVIQGWADGEFGQEIEFTEEEKAELIEESQLILEIYNY